MEHGALLKIKSKKNDIIDDSEISNDMNKKRRLNQENTNINPNKKRKYSNSNNNNNNNNNNTNNINILFDEIKEAKKEMSKITQSQLKKLRIERNNNEKTLRNMNEQKTKVEYTLGAVENALFKMKNSSIAMDKHIFGSRRRKEKQFKAWAETQEFSGQFFGPIVQEMTVRDDLHVKYFNNIMGTSLFYGYVCENDNDLRKLLRKSQDLHLHCTIYKAPQQNDNDDFSRPIDKNTLKQNGINGYLDEIYEAHDIIKRTLNSVLKLNETAYSMNNVNTIALDNVLLVHKGQSDRLRSLITPEYVYSAKESHNTNNVMRTMNGLHSFGRYAILQKTPDYTDKIHETEKRRNEIQIQLKGIELQKKEIENKKKFNLIEIHKCQDRKNSLQRKIHLFYKLIELYEEKNEKIKLEESKIAKEFEQFKQNSHKKMEKFAEEIKKLNERIYIYNGTSENIRKDRIDFEQLNEFEKELMNGMNRISKSRERLMELKNKCIVCRVNNKNIVFMDGCNHIVLCMECENKLNAKQCPMCRANYTNVRKMNL